MKAIVVTDYAKLDLQDIPKPVVSAKKVLIKVAYCGICGSDLPRYFDGDVHSYPQILGHEFSGVIEEIGEGVTHLKVGDRVAVAPLVPCHQCNNCRKGLPSMCTDYSFIGSREQGAMAQYICAPEQNCLKIPEGISLKEASLLEPLTVALHGIERVNIQAGMTIIVYGAGTIGLLTLLSLRARGVGEIIIVDLNQQKLELAKKLGADVIINPNKIDIKTFFAKNELPDVVIETAGSPITQIGAIEYVGRRGKVVYVGTCTQDIKFPPEIFEKLVRYELEVTGSWMSYSAPFPGYEWTTGLRYMATKEVDVMPLITGIFSLEDTSKPFDEMRAKNSHHIKLLYKIGDHI